MAGLLNEQFGRGGPGFLNEAPAAGTVPQQQAAQPVKVKNPGGVIELGNIDVMHRPVHHNEDGSISTVRSISINDGQAEILIPTIADDGTPLSDTEAADLYMRTGKHLGKFTDAAHADRYAQILHKQQEQLYSQDPAP